MKFLITLIAALALSVGLEARNLIFIISDDLRDLHTFGDQVYTPNLDSLRAESVVFDRAYCAYPMCGPARVSLMTGLYPISHGVYNNGTSMRDSLRFYPYLHEIIRDNQYETYGIGKIFHHSPDTNHREFDVEYKIKDDEQTTALSLSYLDEAYMQNETFAMFIGLYKPHAPFDAPVEFQDYNINNVSFVTEPNLTLTERGYRYGFFKEDRNPEYTDTQKASVIANYYNNVRWMDHNLGLILAAIDPDDIVIFTSDHGYSLAEHETHARGKEYLIEANSKVPLYIRHPDFSPRVINQVVSHVDVYNTVLDLLNINGLVKTDGESLLPLMSGDSNWRDWAFVERTTDIGRTGGYRINTPNWGFTDLFRTKYGKVLHDPINDPHGFDNVYQDNPSIIAGLESLVPQEYLNYYSRLELVSLTQANYDDRDGDGLPNGVELLLGQDPIDSSKNSHIVLGDFGIVRYYASPNTTTILEGSSDLQNWVTLDQKDTEGVYWTVPYTNQPCFYYRLRYEN